MAKNGSYKTKVKSHVRTVNTKGGKVKRVVKSHNRKRK